jgi:DNA-binding IclR family transcriptional regulator
MSNTYKPVQSDYKFIDIIEFLHQQTRPVSGAEISRALDLPHPTVMSHLTVALERKWVKQTGEQYEPGVRLAGMYSAFKLGLQTRINAQQEELNTLEV